MKPLTRRPLLLLAFALPGAAAYFGVVFDVSWHIDRGRDHFDIPPHLVMIAGMQAGGLLATWLLVRTARAAARGERLHTPLASWRGRAFSPLALVVLVCFAAPGIVIGIDEGWHRVFGLDVSAWSPTHLTALYTAALGGLAFAAYLSCELNALVPGRRGQGERRLRDLHPSEAWLVSAFGVFGAGLLVLLVEYDFDLPQFDLAYAPILLAALTAFPVFAGRGALGARYGGTAIASSIVAYKLAGFGLLALLGRTRPDLPLGILAGALAADLALRRGGVLLGLAAYPVTLVGAEWARLGLLGQLQWTEGLWPLGAPLAVPAAMATGALGLLAGWALRPAGARPLRAPAALSPRRLIHAGVLLAALVAATPALAHGGYGRDIVLSRMDVAPARPAAGEPLRVRVVVGAADEGGAQPPFLDSPSPRLGAFRAGTWLDAPLSRTGPRTFEGELRPDAPGRWVIWPKWTLGDERWIDRAHLTVSDSRGGGGTRTFLAEIAPEADPVDAAGWIKPLAYLAMIAIWAAVTWAMAWSLRLVARRGFGETA